MIGKGATTKVEYYDPPIEELLPAEAKEIDWEAIRDTILGELPDGRLVGLVDGDSLIGAIAIELNRQGIVDINHMLPRV